MTCFKDSYSIKFENKMDKFLDTHNTPKISQYEINHLIRIIAVDKIKASKGNLGPNGIADEFCQIFFKKRTKTILFQFFHEYKWEEGFHIGFVKKIIALISKQRRKCVIYK